jgi:hypothetical protein
MATYTDLDNAQSIELVGFPGDSERSGYQRLYLNSTLDHFAEFATGDVLSSAAAAVSPFPAQEAVSVRVLADAQVDYTRTLATDEFDDFDLDVRVESLQFIDPVFSTAFTSCGGCYTMGASCTICPSKQACPKASQKNCPTEKQCPGPSSSKKCPPQ